jgi:diguanylate cyclase (GGDEF)-like protein
VTETRKGLPPRAAPPYGVKVVDRHVDSERVSPAPDESYDEAVTALLPAVAAGLAVLFAVLLPMQLLLLDGRDRVVLVAATAAAAVVVGAFALVVKRRRIPEHMSQPATAGLLVVAVSEAVLALALTGEPRQTSSVMLVVALAGALLLSLRWLGATLYLTWGAWGVGAFFVGPDDHWPFYVAGMAGATALAFLVNHLRRADLRALSESYAAAEAAAVRDHLSGLANRRGLAMVGAQMVEQARRQGDAVHAIFVDIDGLKRVNDALGYAAGDEVIVAVSEALRSATRGTDVVARWGGDEFCVVGPGPGMPPLELERRVREGVVLASDVSGDVWPVRVSAGGAMLAPWDSGTLETLLSKADQEMYLRRALRKEGAPLPPRRASADSPPAGDAGS